MKYIYGLNKSGISIINYLENNKLSYVAWDDNIKRRKEVSEIYNKIVFKDPKNIDYSKIKESYITPGIDLKAKKINILRKKNINLFRDLELYSQLISNQKIIAISGTNGKSTTTKLIGDLILLSKKKCFVGGNIGKPLIEFKNTNDKSNYHVIELSSFQLESAPSFISNISILLNISKDHLDRYNKFNDYVNQKKKIFNKKKSSYKIISVDDIYCNKIYKKLDKNNLIPISINKHLYKGIFLLDNIIVDNYFHKNKRVKIKNVSKSLHGKFNFQNIIASYVICKILKINLIYFQKNISNFIGLPHRLELIFENKSLLIVNNSKATNLESLFNSLDNYKNIYLIVGGKIKEKKFDLISKYKKNIYKSYIIGDSSQFIYNKINKSIDSIICRNLEKAVNQIFKDLKQSNSKSTILLSPGCSSFDQFQNFEDRGNQFKKMIKKKLSKSNV